MKKANYRLSERASALCALALLVGCDGTLTLGTDASGGGAGGQFYSEPASAGRSAAGESGNTAGAGGSTAGAGGSTAGVGGFPLPAPSLGGSPGTGGSGGLGYAGTYNFANGVDCQCYGTGDSRCDGPLFALCGQIPGCKLSLSDVQFSDICDLDPTQAEYSAGDRTVITYRTGSSNKFRMVFDTASGDLVGGELNGQVGLACNLAGNSWFFAGEQVEHTAPTCNLCSTGGATCPPAAP